MGKIYLIDTSSILIPYKTYYNPQIAPLFWDKFASFLSSKGKVKTIKKVIQEISNYHRKDWIQNWMDQNFIKGNLVISEDKELGVVEYYGLLINWAESETRNGRFKKTALDEFLEYNNADPWLIATAKWLVDSGYECIIITEEKNEPNAKRKIFLPVAAYEVFQIRCISILDFMKIEGLKLI